MAEKIVAIADFSIVPIGTGKTSMGEYIAAPSAPSRRTSG